MKRLIINSDDYGLTDGISRAILKLWKMGIVTSVSIMGNVENEKYGEWLLENNIPSLGIHFNITSGKPVSKGGKRFLTDIDGRFFNFPSLIKMLSEEKLELGAVEEEFFEQGEQLKNWGLKLSHSDSHKHIHMLEPISPLFLNICRELRIDRGRFPTSLGSALFTTQNVSKNDAEKLITKIVPTNFITTDCFLGTFKVGEVSAITMDEIISECDGSTYELMVHPGFVDEKLLKLSSLTHLREKEYENLASPEFINWFKRSNFTIINFEDLGKKDENT
jgi:predicted glycoside hydrolase/deacetylase ChbG (UPF0249 family)